MQIQFCEYKKLMSYPIFQALDFIAGFPASEGMLTYNPSELQGDRQWLGRIRCIGYSIAHAISIPISPVIALVRIVAVPIFLGLICDSKMRTQIFFCWIVECTSVITSPLRHVAGVARSALGIIVPDLYLKAPWVSELSKSQTNQAAEFLHQNYSPSARR